MARILPGGGEQSMLDLEENMIEGFGWELN